MTPPGQQKDPHAPAHPRHSDTPRNHAGWLRERAANHNTGTIPGPGIINIDSPDKHFAYTEHCKPGWCRHGWRSPQLARHLHGPRVGPFFDGGPEDTEYLLTCLTDLGFPVRPASDGHGFYTSGDASPSALRAGVVACGQKAVDIGLVVRPGESNQYLTIMFQAYAWLTQCLLDHGIPAPDPPSLDTFLEGGLESWYPYSGFPSGGEVSVHEGASASPDVQRQLQIQAECPIHPAELLPKVGITPSDLANLPTP